MPKGDRRKLKADCEDGYTRIANVLLQALCAVKLNGTQQNIINYIIRKSFGWGRTEVAISLDEFAKNCDTTKQYISRQLKVIVDKKIVIRCEYQPGKTPVYKINTLIAEWDSSSIDLEKFAQRINEGFNNKTKKVKSYSIRQRLPESIKRGSHKYMMHGLSEQITVNRYVIKNGQVINNILKKRINKDKEILVAESDAYRLSILLLNKILEHFPQIRKPNLHKWEMQMDQLIKIDKRNAEEIEQVIMYAQADSFWRTNILSPRKLRQQFDMLNAKMKRENEKKKSSNIQHLNDYEIFIK